MLLIGYTVGIHAFYGHDSSISDHGTFLGVVFVLMFSIGIHAAINFGAALIHLGDKDKQSRQAYFLSGVLVLLLGFSLCRGSIELYG